LSDIHPYASHADIIEKEQFEEDEDEREATLESWALSCRWSIGKPERRPMLGIGMMKWLSLRVLEDAFASACGVFDRFFC
jgi:hypothetical protein